MSRTATLAAVLLSASVSASTALAADPPKVWAIVVGIDAYEDAKIPGGRGAASDARALATWLTTTAGWPTRQVLVMDGSSEKPHGRPADIRPDLYPSRENLDWALREWLPYRARPGDLVLVYFAGQAIGGKADDPKARDRLLPIDARSDRIDESGWSLADALDPLAQKGQNPILCLLDTSLAGRGRPAADLKGRRVDSGRFLAEVTRWPGTAAWIAADGRPSLVPSAPRERGAFLNATLSAMGPPERPINLLGALFAASRDDRLASRGFRAAGAVGPGLALWPKMLADATPPPSELLLQRGHADRITAIAFSADGATAVTASMDSTIKVWRTADRTMLRSLPAHLIGVTALALSPDGVMLASGDGSGRVILWSLADLKPRRIAGRSPHEAPIARIEFLGDGSGFAALDSDGKAVLWTPEGRTIKPSPISDRASAIAAGREWVATALEPIEGTTIVVVHDRAGREVRRLSGAEGRIETAALAVRGDRIVSGDGARRVRAWSYETGQITLRFDAEAPITALALTEDAILAAAGGKLCGIATKGDVAPTSLPLQGETAGVVASNDGRSAAVVPVRGQVAGFAIPAPGKIERVRLDVPNDGSAPCTVAAFTPDGKALLSGDQDGGVRTWEWPSGTLRSRMKPTRGRIDAMAASKDGRTLVQIDHDFAARVWDLREGRGLKRIAGQWIDAAFAPDGRTVALTERAGDVALVDPVTTARRPVDFARPKTEAGRRMTWGFGPVAVSPDGRLVAAGSRQGPIAAVWRIEGGEPVQVANQHTQPILAVDFAGDSRHWVTASRDGTARVWSLDAKGPLWTLKAPPAGGDPAVTAARVAPGPLARVVTGHRDGRVIAWDLKPEGRSVPTVLTTLDGEIGAMAFSDDGARLVAGGADKTAWHWTFEPGAWPPQPAVRLEPQHGERINAVACLAEGRLFATAGYDTSVRFWKADGSALVGTIATSSEDGTWVAFDPEGRFDSAPGGETHVTFLRADRVLTLDQFDAGGRIYGLGAMWLAGQAPPTAPPFLAGRPAGLALDPPVTRRGDEEAEVRVRLGEASPKSLRLYRNDLPIRGPEDFHPAEEAGVYSVRARLEPGENRFVAMGAREPEGAVFGRSNVAIVRGPSEDSIPRGAVHTLALGISAYEANALQFAHSDAEAVSAFLERHGFASGAQRGVTKLLRDKQVRPDAVEAALDAIGAAARPEDTVVVFLAGHTDVRRDDRFCLLLDKFPFAPDALAVGQRGPIRTRGGVGEAEVTKSILPYAAIYRSLARMDAKNRLVVIDACQAGAIFDDPAVRRIRMKVDDDAHGARTSYLLAARKGEPANEAAALRHGLMTYLMLRGMGSEGLEPAPLPLGDADVDADGVVTTAELQQYLDINLPRLAERVAPEGPRANPDARGPRSDPKADPATARGATATFPVARVPKGR